MKTIVFFNNKGGVGKTSLVYHLAWKYEELGVKVVAADFDPQANLTSMFLSEDRLEELWPDNNHKDSLLGAITPILKGTGDINAPHVEMVGDQLGLVVGDLGLSRFEDKLSSDWPLCLGRKEAAFRAVSALYRIVLAATQKIGADLALIDVGPNLGAINRAAMIGANYVIIPLTPDLYSLQGLKNLGPTLRDWREEWKERLNKKPDDPDLSLPGGEMEPGGYVIMQHAVRSDRPVSAYGKWMRRIPGEYRRSVLPDPPQDFDNVMDDPHCLSTVKHFRSLMPMAMEARKPIFQLKPADGAIGAHMAAVMDCSEIFKNLATSIAGKCGIPIP